MSIPSSSSCKKIQPRQSRGKKKRESSSWLVRFFHSASSPLFLRCSHPEYTGNIIRHRRRWAHTRQYQYQCKITGHCKNVAVNLRSSKNHLKFLFDWLFNKQIHFTLHLNFQSISNYTHSKYAQSTTTCKRGTHLAPCDFTFWWCGESDVNRTLTQVMLLLLLLSEWARVGLGGQKAHTVCTIEKVHHKVLIIAGPFSMMSQVQKIVWGCAT